MAIWEKRSIAVALRAAMLGTVMFIAVVVSAQTREMTINFKYYVTQIVFYQPIMYVDAACFSTSANEAKSHSRHRHGGNF